MTGFGSVVFPKLGIALTGYLPNDEQIKAVSAFAEGRWDRVLAKGGRLDWFEQFRA